MDLYLGDGEYNAADGSSRWGGLADSGTIDYVVSHHSTRKIVIYGTSAGTSDASFQGIVQPNVAGIVMDSNTHKG